MLSSQNSDGVTRAQLAAQQWNALWTNSVSTRAAAAPQAAAPASGDAAGDAAAPQLSSPDEMRWRHSMAVLAMLSGLVVAAVVFEALKRYSMKNVPELLMPSFNALLREVAVLGMLGLIGYAVIQTGLLATWGRDSFQGEEATVVQMLFEHVHFYVFVMASLYVLQGALMLANAYWVSRKWHGFEVSTIDTTIFSFWRAVGERARRSIGLLDFSRQRRHNMDVERMEFAVMRRDFMRPRLADLPLDSDFRFSDYLTAVLSRTLSSVVEIPVSTWLAIEAAFVVLRMAMGNDVTVQILVFTLLGFSMLALQVAVYRKLRRIYALTAGDSPTLAEMKEVITRRGANAAESDSSAVQVMEELIAVFLHPSRLVPRALLQPVQSRIKNGMLFSRVTPQQALFPFGDQGPATLLFAIRACAFFVAAYTALVFVVFAGEASAAYGTAGSVLVSLLMLVPPAFMAFNLSRILELYSIVTSQEDLRDDDLVQSTLQRQFAQQERSARTLLAALAAQQAADADKAEPLPSPQEVETALRAAFNSVDRENQGTVDADDLAILLQRVGLRVSPSLLVQLRAQADPEDAKRINFEGFRTVALRIMSARVNVRDTVRRAFCSFKDSKEKTYPEGKLTAQPFTELVRGATGEQLEEEAVDFLFRDADDDEDGFVTWDQFAALMQAHANRGVLYEPSVGGSESYTASGSEYSSVTDDR